MKKNISAGILSAVFYILIVQLAFGAGFFEQGTAPAGGYPSAPTFTHVGTGSVTATDNITGTGATDLKNFRNGFFTNNITGSGSGTISGYFGGGLKFSDNTALDNIVDGSFLLTLKTQDVISRGPDLDVRSYMDGLSGRNTLAAWQANNTINVTAAIQAAINVVAARGGGTVSFPSGNFSTTATLTLASGVRLIGSGMDVTTLNYTGASDAISAIGTSGSPIVKIEVSNMAIVGAGGAVSGVVFHYCHYSTLRNVRIRSFQVGFQADFSWDNLLEFIYTESCSQDGFWFSQTANNFTLVGCIGVNNTRAGFYFVGGSQISLYGCVAETNGYGVYVSSFDNGATEYRPKAINWNGGYIEGNTTYEFYIEKGGVGYPVPRGISIRDTLFTALTGKAAHAIRIQDADGLIIDGNTFDDADTTYNYSGYINGTGSVSGVVWGSNKDTSTGGIYAELPFHDIWRSTARAFGKVSIATDNTVTINNHYGVDNVVRNLAGEYTVSLKTALPDANYSVLCNAENGASFVAMICSVSGPSQAVGSFIVHTADNTAHLSDARTFYIQVFR